MLCHSVFVFKVYSKCRSGIILNKCFFDGV